MNFGLNSEEENKEKELKAKDILYADSFKEKEQKERRNNLLHELGDNLTDA